MNADGLFVYGSLRPGGPRHAWLKRTDPLGSTEAYAPGRLFHLPSAGFPALVEGPEPLEPPPGPGCVNSCRGGGAFGKRSAPVP